MTKYFTQDGDNYTEVADPLHTQADVDQIINTRLERERGKFSDYDALKEKAGKVDTLNAEWETKLADSTGKVESLTKDLGAAKLETDKVKIVTEFKLSDELAEFVTGTTPEEMRTRAEKLAKGTKGGTVNLDKKPKPTDDKTAQSKELAGKLFGKKSD